MKRPKDLIRNQNKKKIIEVNHDEPDKRKAK